MQVLVFDQQKDLSIASESVKPVVKAVLQLEERQTDEVAVYFVSTEEICHLHEEFFQDPSPTDCISFPMDRQEQTPHHMLGEIFICPKTALDYILTSGEEVSDNPYQELTLYLVHGLLHLLGYKDKQPLDKEKMRAAENRHMHYIIQHNLLLR